VLNDFKLIHQAATMGDAEHALADFIDKWQKTYPKVTGKLENNSHHSTCFTFSAAVAVTSTVQILLNRSTRG